MIYDPHYLSYLEKKSAGEIEGLPGLYQSTGAARKLMEYEHIKSELKDEFDKRIALLKGKLLQRA